MTDTTAPSPAPLHLSKLEYFTAAALTGLLAADTEGNLTAERAAQYATAQAQAVLKLLAVQESE